jgi:alanine racemase
MEPKEYIWGFAVAAVPEAQELRSSGITKPILVLGYTFAEDYAWMARNGVRPVLFTEEMMREFAAAAGAEGVTAPFHAAVDTGMSRIGFADTDESVRQIAELSSLPSITLEGVFTHFARADEADKTWAKEQYRRFTSFCDRLKHALGSDFICHCANTAAIIDMPEMAMDMVRAGISIYGIYPSDEVERPRVSLRPVMELKSHVVHVREIAPGTQISYGGTFTAQQPMTIATIPVGYGDGYPRSLSNQGYVLIHGRKAYITGRVCMDQFMVDVTGMDVRVLDEVTLLGRDGDASITVDELSELSGRFPYEFVCDIGKRIPRVYSGS